MKHMMEFTAEMIAGFLGGDIVGNKDAKVHTVSSIEEGKAGSMAYLRLMGLVALGHFWLQMARASTAALAGAGGDVLRLKWKFYS